MFTNMLFGGSREFLPAPAGTWQVGYVDVMTEGEPKLSSFTRYSFTTILWHFLTLKSPKIYFRWVCTLLEINYFSTLWNCWLAIIFKKYLVSAELECEGCEN